MGSLKDKGEISRNGNDAGGLDFATEPNLGPPTPRKAN